MDYTALQEDGAGGIPAPECFFANGAQRPVKAPISCSIDFSYNGIVYSPRE